MVTTLKFFLVLLLAFSVLFVFPVSQVKAGTQTITRVFYTSTDDGYIYNISTNYATVRTATSGQVISGYNYSTGAQILSGYFYYMYRAFVPFDTSLIPSTATINNATLSVKIQADQSTTDFNLTIQSGMPTYPHLPLSPTDFYYGLYAGNGGSRNTSDGLAVGSYWNITLNTQGKGWINKDGYTKFCLRSSRDIAGLTPTGFEKINYYTREYGETSAPKLYITYTYTGIVYLFHGPFYENGYAYDGIVNMTLYEENTAPTHFSLPNGTVANTFQLEAEHPVYFTWNISSTLLNHTRTFFVNQDAVFEEIYVTVPNVDEPYYLYSFSLVALASITNPFLESTLSLNGTTVVVERQKCDTVNSVGFWLTFGHRYGLTLKCDEGTYSFGSFMAQTQLEQTLTVTDIVFPRTYPTMNVSVSASRTNGTHIQVLYNDELESTYWVDVNIGYTSLGIFTSIYETNNTGNTQVINWNSANNETDYIAKVTAKRISGTYVWKLPCNAPLTTTNVWSELDTLFPDSPIPLSQALGFAIVMSFFGMSSFADRKLGLFIGLIMCGVMIYIRFLNINTTVFAIGCVIGIFAILVETKKEIKLEGVEF